MRYEPAAIWASDVEGSAFNSLSDCSAAYMDSVSNLVRGYLGSEMPTFRKSEFFRLDS